MLSGESHLSFSPVSTGISHAQSGKLRMLGVSSPKRIAALPDLPTIAETVPGYEYSGWQGVLVPVGTPAEIIGRLHAAIVKGTSAPDFKAYLFKEGSEYVGSNPEQFAAFLRSEVKKNADLVKSAGIKAQ